MSEPLTKNERRLDARIKELEGQRSSDSSYAMTMLGSLMQKVKTLEKVVVLQDKQIKELIVWTRSQNIDGLQKRVKQLEQLHKDLQADQAMYIEGVKARARSRIVREAGEGARRRIGNDL